MPFGIPLVYAAIFSPAVRWIVRRGRIDIVLRNPIFLRRHHVLPGDIASFSLRTIEWDSGGPTYTVVLTTVNGERFETRDFETTKTAEMFRDRIKSVLTGA